MTTKKVFDGFCPKCDNMLDITRSIPKMTDDMDIEETPKQVSDDENESGSDNENNNDEDDGDSGGDDGDDGDDINGTDYETILRKVEAGDKLTTSEINSIDLKNMVKNEYYKKMAKKGETKKFIANLKDETGNSDENIQAYMTCPNCGFNKVIDSGFRVLSKNPEGATSSYDYVNEASYRNKIHINTMPRTRNFKCLNKGCPTNKGKIASEAIFFRKNANMHELIYVCTKCLTIKVN